LISHDCRARLIVFGQARIASRIPGYSIDPIDYVINTEWMAPEQLSPEKYGLDRRLASKEADIYALGVVIYEVLFFLHPRSRCEDQLLSYRS
jgi:serine/threonine protein kinase